MKKKILIVVGIIIIIVVGIVIYFKLSKNRIIEVISNAKDYEELENGLSSSTFEGDDYFDTFLDNGGTTSDAGVLSFLKSNILGTDDLSMNIEGAGCSTLQVSSTNNEYLFGRNFDWYNNNALIVTSTPTNGYKSISTVNLDFITMAGSVSNLPNDIITIASLYAPLDGMNEKGLAVSVNMIEDGDSINQNTNKKDITTTTAVRLLLNKASNVDEAVELLKSYDMHSSMGWMVHFMIADSLGNSVAVEYINNEISVVETDILTNYYITEGNKYGIGSLQSKDRFEIIKNAISKDSSFNADNVRDILDSVSKHNYNDGETTEWSIIFNQSTLDATYYHRENFNKKYTFSLK